MLCKQFQLIIGSLRLDVRQHWGHQTCQTLKMLTLYQTVTLIIFCSIPQNPDFRLLKTLRKRAFENIVGKRENAGDQQFIVFFPQCFLPYDRQILQFLPHLTPYRTTKF